MLQLPYAFPFTFSFDIISCNIKFKKYIFSTYVLVKIVKVETGMLTSSNFLRLNFCVTAGLDWTSVAHLIATGSLLRMLLVGSSTELLSFMWSSHGCVKSPMRAFGSAKPLLANPSGLFLMFFKHIILFQKIPHVCSFVWVPVSKPSSAKVVVCI